MIRKGALVMASAMLVASGGVVSAADEPFDLEVLVFETPALTPEFWDTGLANAAEGIEGLNVVKLVTPDLDRTAYAKQLQATGQFPDLQAALILTDFVDAGLLQPFDDAFLQENFLFPDATKVAGSAYQTPSGGQIVSMMYYNEDIFAELGLEEPTTYDEFVQVSQAAIDGGYVPVAFAGSEPWSASLPMSTIFATDVLGPDPDWVIKRTNGEVCFSDDNVVAAAAKWKELVDMGAVDSGSIGVDYQGATNAFLDGEAAMYLMGSWWLGAAPGASFPVGVFPFPTAGGETVIPLHIGGLFSVSSEVEDVDRAMEFAQNWALDPYTIQFFVEADGLFGYAKGLTAADIGAEVLPIFDESFGWTIDDAANVVPAFAWTNNDQMLLPPGFSNEFYASAQNIFLGDDPASEMARLDGAYGVACGG
ncbi:MAG: extracellular solute-binding protein [Chloroflexota bacterium]|nr:extracellular solute-binding protein [Chloroflexota bacterium]